MSQIPFYLSSNSFSFSSSISSSPWDDRTPVASSSDISILSSSLSVYNAGVLGLSARYKELAKFCMSWVFSTHTIIDIGAWPQSVS